MLFYDASFHRKKASICFTSSIPIFLASLLRRKGGLAAFLLDFELVWKLPISKGREKKVHEFDFLLP